MEILGGLARGLVLDVPAGSDVRPTSVRARRGLFDSLNNELQGKRVCDLFAGSGALGLEALSRGASSVISVEASAASIASIRANVKRFCGRVPDPEKESAASAVRVIQGTLPGCCRQLINLPHPDLIFADPPYADSTERMKELLADKDFLSWSEDSLLIWELPESRTLIQSLPPSRKILAIKKFGPIRFMFVSKS